MRIVKHEHAFIEVQAHDTTVVIDPGSFTTQLPELTALAAVIVTHEHNDHLAPANLEALRGAFPQVPIFVPQAVADALGEVAAGLDVTVVSPGDIVEADGFVLSFLGGEHAVIHSSIPVIENLAVVIDSTVYYPGDSLVEPGEQITVLAVPSAAPWLKASEAMDFITAVAPDHVFPTHNFLWSEAGEQIADKFLTMAADEAGADFHALGIGDSLEL